MSKWAWLGAVLGISGWAAWKLFVGHSIGSLVLAVVGALCFFGFIELIAYLNEH